MSTAPPPPPPPPPLPPLPCNGNSPANTAKHFDASPSVNYSTDNCKWASQEPQLREACVKFSICLHDTPYMYRYKHFESILQVGPTCGLVALSMAISGEVTAEEMLNICKMRNYSCHGEMLSCKVMCQLIEKVLSLADIEVRFSLKVGGLYSDETIERLLCGAVLLVPYDADFNHSPCCRNGHTAHWALICGVILSEDPGSSYTKDMKNVHVFTRHGKSSHVAAWSLAELDKSNKNLFEFSPKKEDDGLLYAMPIGGLGGENGLKNQFIIIEGL